VERSGKNTIVGSAGREERRRVRAPDRERGRRRMNRENVRGKIIVKDAIHHVLSL